MAKQRVQKYVTTYLKAQHKNMRKFLIVKEDGY